MVGSLPAGQAKSLTLGEVVGAGLPAFSKAYRLPAHHWKVLNALTACHTEALGGYVYQCIRCGKYHLVPHSCGNRHCPSCQKLESAQWLERQMEHVLPVPYFHVVFTLPHDFNPLIQYNQKLLYGLLFSSATSTLLDFGRNNLKAQVGIIAVLHTWSQTLLDHYHLHCVVPAGGLSLDGKRWVSRSAKWLFPVKALSIVYRAKFRDGLQELFDQGRLQFPASQPELAKPEAFAQWLAKTCRRQWVVYTKRPFAGPEAVLGYLCRYTHRVAISNSRLESLDRQKGTVTFRYKDYAGQSQIRSKTLDLVEFLRRFCLHILPLRLVKIRHYGLLSNRDCDRRLAQVRALIPPGAARSPEELFTNCRKIQKVERPPLVCPYCGSTAMVLINDIRPLKAPPVLDSS